MMKNIIFDGDPGHDDSIAFLVALGNPDKFKILGFSTICGNSKVENCAKNILKIMDYVGVKIPVAVGYEQPIVKPLVCASAFHGETGLDGCLNYPEATSKPIDKHAVMFLKELIENCDDKVTIVTMGPLTNIAILLKTFPNLIDKIDEIVVMGGSYASGNSLAKAEFNMYADPEAASIVFNSDVHIVLATIEAANAGKLLLTEQERFKDGGRISKLVYDIMKFYSRWAIKNGWDGTAIYDLATVMYLVAPEIYTYKDLPCDIELDGKYTRGMTVCDERGPTYVGVSENPKRILLSCNREKYISLLFEAINKLDELYG